MNNNIHYIYKYANLFCKRANEETEEEIESDDEVNLTEVPSPNFAHNYYLDEAIEKLGFDYYALDSYTRSELMGYKNKFVDDNIGQINKIRRFFSKAQPEILGEGADGIAYDIGNFVLKLYTDGFVHNENLKTVERLHQGSPIAKTEAMIYDVGSLGILPNNQEMYYLIIEKMTPTGWVKGYVESTNLHRIVNKIHDYIDRYYLAMINNMKNHLLDEAAMKEKIKKYMEDTKVQIKKYCKYEIGTINDSDELKDKLRASWFEDLVEQVFDKVVTSRGDLHMGNLGITGYGTFCFFDPAHQDWTDRINY